jgi:hypothetical protein
MSLLEDDESMPDLIDQVNLPSDVALQQQSILAWSPILHPEWMIYTFLIMAMILIPTGKLYCSLLSGECGMRKKQGR